MEYETAQQMPLPGKQPHSWLYAYAELQEEEEEIPTAVEAITTRRSTNMSSAFNWAVSSREWLLSRTSN